MPTRLKSLELHGYKTFASRTLFEFAGTVTAIVGPNGSGKSNIADSLRWVLGEQSYSLLRGKRTEDMIFSGSEQRPRAGMASATVVFDNSDGWLPIEYTEVAVARRAYRDGNNEYLINGQRVRLKDVSELLAKSGLAERTYTIIGQGVVDAALALKPEERRRLFEEAAGIGLYRSRREEAVRRLETTRRNLDRVQDILAELQPRLRSLERQARRAVEYEQVRADLKLLLLEWYGYHWHRAQQELAEARDHARQQEHELGLARQALNQMDERLSVSREHIHALRGRLNGWHRQLAALHTHQESLGRALAVADERRRMLENRQVELTGGLSSLEEEHAFQQVRLESARQEAAQLESQAVEARREAQNAHQALQTRLRQRQEAESALANARTVLASLESQHGQAQARLSERHAQLARLENTLPHLEETIQIAQAQAEHARGMAESSLEAVAAAESEQDQGAVNLEVARNDASELENQRQKAQAKLRSLEIDLARLKAQASVLEQAETDLNGYTQGAQVLLKAAREHRLAAKHQSLGAQIEMPAEIETAVAAALGEYLDGVVLEGEAAVEVALDLLAGQPMRGVLLPLDGVRSRVLSPDALGNNLEGIIGLASERVICPPALKGMVDLLLGRTVIVRDRNSARQLLTVLKDRNDANQGDIRVVTQVGEIFHAAGPVVAGQEGRAAVLGRNRQKKELKGRIDQLEGQFAANSAELRDLDEQAETLRKRITLLGDRQRQLRSNAEQVSIAQRAAAAASDKANREVAWQVEQRQRIHAEVEDGQAQLTQLHAEIHDLEVRLVPAREIVREHVEKVGQLSLEELQSEVGLWNTRAAVAERLASDAAARCNERQSATGNARAQLDAARQRLEETIVSLFNLAEEKEQQRQDEVQVSGEIAVLRQQIDPAEAELDAAEEEQAGLQGSDAVARQALSAAEARHAQARINLARRQESLETWRRRIEDDFGLVAFDYAEDVSGQTPLPLGELVEELPWVEQLNMDLEENVRRQRAQLRRMGPVNPEAQVEYQEVKERFAFMTAQVIDLEKAEEDVRQVIKELDELMEIELRKTFDQVAGEFGGIFKRLFGGGSARLMLTDPDDMTNTGIDIEARLPGRRMQGLSLLSGGERSLTAVSLIFALLKVSPTPFCVLDEVDAMLDEANVGRFRELLSELSAETQFIIVTHNRNTVQVADVIYGVTMGRDSTSQVISLKLDQVPTIVE